MQINTQRANLSEPAPVHDLKAHTTLATRKQRCVGLSDTSFLKPLSSIDVSCKVISGQQCVQTYITQEDDPDRQFLI